MLPVSRMVYDLSPLRRGWAGDRVYPKLVYLVRAMIAQINHSPLLFPVICASSFLGTNECKQTEPDVFTFRTVLENA